MIDTGDFIITEATESRIDEVSLENIPFGKYFTDHMLEVNYDNGKWETVEIKPYQALTLDPSTAALHYGQAIFEGVKAYKGVDGEIRIFRPEENFKRFNHSAHRMEMPEISSEIFLDGLKELVKMDHNWVPGFPDHSLYIRPFMFSSDPLIGVHTSKQYKFLIILSPTGPYYNAPMRIYVEEKYVRAVPGGVGSAKAAGNYGAAMFPSAEAKRKGYDQVLWTDAFEHKYVQECGTMNVFFIIGNKAITPTLAQETILAGVTRDSTITLLKEMGVEVEERRLSIDEIEDAYKAGELHEVFGTGTAVTISMIKELRYKDFVMNLNVEEAKIAPAIKKRMDAIKYGTGEDTFNWMVKI